MRIKTLLFLFILAVTHSYTFAEERILRIGISSMITPVDTVKYYDDIVNYIGKKMGTKVTLIHRKRYEEMNRLIMKKEIDIAFICTAAYVHLAENANIEIVSAPVKEEKPFYRSFIIVHKDSDIKSFVDLKGKSFVFVDPLSNTGYLYPVYRVISMKSTPDKFFSKTSFSYSHNKSIELVAKRLVDGAGVENLVFEYMKEMGSPYISQVKVIEESVDFASPPVIIRSDLPENIKRQVKSIMFNMHNDSEGKEILKNMKIKKFVAVQDKDYDTVRSMLTFVEKITLSPERKKLKNELVFVIPDSKNPRILFEKFQPLVDYLSKSIGTPVHLAIKEHNELRRLIKNGYADMGIAGVLDFMNVGKNKIDILAVPRNKNNASNYRVVFITKREDIRKLSDLKGKKIGFGPVKSDELNFIPRLMLAKEGMHLAELKSYKHYSYEDSIIKALLKGEIDAGVIRDIHKDKVERLGFKMIEESEYVYYGPLFVNAELPKDLKNKIEKAILNIPEEVLKKMDFDFQGGFVKPNTISYKSLENSYKEIPKGCGVRCHPGSKI